MGGPAAHPETTGSRARTPVEDDPRLSTGSTSTWKFPRSRARVSGWGTVFGRASVSNTATSKGAGGEHCAIRMLVHNNVFWSTFNHPVTDTSFRIRRRGSYTATDRSAIGLVLRYRGTDGGRISERRTTMERACPFSAMDHSADQRDGTHCGVLFPDLARKDPPAQSFAAAPELTPAT